MCQFISLILRNRGKVEVYSHILELRKRKLFMADAMSALKHLKSGEFLAYPQGKSCDCGTALGTYHPHFTDKRTSQHEIEALTKPLIKKGWTHSKISRWLEEREKYIAREARLEKQRHGHLDEIENPDPDGWVETISQLLELSNEKYAGILLQWSPGNKDFEKALSSKRRMLSISDDVGLELYKMDEDVVYEIHS